MKKICILGLGYVGLPTALTLANLEFDVLGIDIKEDHINNIKNGLLNFREYEIQKLFKKVINKSNFRVGLRPEQSDIYIIAVPTPFLKSSYSIPKPDISFVINAIKSIINFLKKDDLIIIESTCPVGTTEKIEKEIIEACGLNRDLINLAYCPERILPGNILKELIQNDRIVGGLTEKASKKAFEFYATFCTGGIHITNSKTAELAKLSENAFRDINIAFANELSMICDELNINSNQLINLTNKHPRVNILSPGCGVGGHCIAIDPWFIVNSTDNSLLIKTARDVNNKKTKWVLDKILDEGKKLESTLKKRIVIGCFGLTYKPNIDDLRESPAIEITKGIMQKGFSTLICEPNIKNHSFLNINPIYEVITNSDLLVFLVAHEEFKRIDLNRKKYLDFCGVI